MKRNITVSVEIENYKNARALKLNISRVCNDALHMATAPGKALKDAQQTLEQKEEEAARVVKERAKEEKLNEELRFLKKLRHSFIASRGNSGEFGKAVEVLCIKYNISRFDLLKRLDKVV